MNLCCTNCRSSTGPAAISGTFVVVVLCIVTLCSGVLSAADTIQRISPAAAGMNEATLLKIEEVVREGIAQEKMPGCVVLVGRRDGVVYHRAFGNLQTMPEPEEMQLDTVFDLASLTKPISTATSIMTLVEQGKIELDQPVVKYLPDFGANGKESITIRQLLTHQAGLIPDNALDDYLMGADEAFRRINELKPTSEPGTKFIYSDVGFLVLGRIVEVVSGKDLHDYSQEKIFQPLGMTETGYLPNESLKRRAAVTEKRNDQWIKGEVHDPRAFELGGVAGHAGLFSTASDLAKYATMMLHGGEYKGARVFSQQTFELMTARSPVSSGYRCLGWDNRTGYSSNRGDLFSDRAFGHGGFTGTAIWIDPSLDLFVVFLSNRVHPDGKGIVNPLAGRICTIAAAAITGPRTSAGQPDTHLAEVQNGIDVLERDRFAQLSGRKIGLITNQTGLSRSGKTTIQLLHDAPNVELVALFSPEHGIEGKLDVSKISDGLDTATGLKIFSLYGETRRPTAESLTGLDTLVFDIQDIGCRFYTYVSTMGHAMQAAAENKVRFVVLDRVNPIGGIQVSGPVLDEGTQSFVGFHTIPVRHGMTIGEIAMMLKEEMDIPVELEVIRMEGWSRGQWFDATGLTWINPSPNMRNLNQALLYPGIGLVEMTNLSVGRGTDTPFELVGAPWIVPAELASELNAGSLSGVRFVPVWFQPESSKFQGERCGGVQILITDREGVEPVMIGLHLMIALRKLYGDSWETKNLNRLLNSAKVLEAALNRRDPKEIELLWFAELDEFSQRRKKFLLYP
ncbi:MAG: DUF1343 domain-containing protein [Planctomyces sp.]|nr:DUF1343 domain-containing protein [Planctomyces sp.]